MPTLRVRVAALVTTLADDLWLAEPLLFPEVSCGSQQLKALPKLLARRIRQLLRELPAAELFRRRLAALPDHATVQVTVPPLDGRPERLSTVTLPLPYVRWRHLDEASLAFIPALGIEVLAADDAQLDAQLLPQILAALGRRKASQSVRELVFLERFSALTVRPLNVTVRRPTLQQAAQREFDEGQAAPSVLKEVATDLRARPAPPLYERGELLQALVDLLTGRPARGVLLVGASGVGKTALMSELASQRSPAAFGRPPCWTTSGSRIVAGQCGYGMWQDRCQKLIREAEQTGAVVHLGNLIELIETGKGGGNTLGVAAMLRPAIASGQFRAVAECTPEQLALVEREDPQFLEAFAVLEVPATTAAQTRAILSRIALDLERAGGRAISAAALAELDRLHTRFATYSAAPGRAVRFLRNLLDDRPPGSGSDTPSLPALVETAEVVAAFSRETGLPRHLLDDAQPLDWQATREWFATRVIGQSEPVELVTDLLAAVKASLVRAGKPIASLLFIGPTGVGKTEMAKALAEFLYQDPARMIRFDMSEYSTPAAVARLIGGADGAPGRLTQEVRDQPFMVVLLDEFEKAHPLVFDMLLQVLGEGRLTDAAGRVADFTNAVLIMTSNLGAETFRPSGLGFGAGGEAAASASQHFEREVRAFLRPELFNRIDRIVPFAPLGRETIARIAHRELDRLRQRDGLKMRDVQLEISEPAVQLLVVAGYAPRYGARPLKRAIERLVVAPLAERLCRYGHDVAVRCRIDAADGALTFDTAASPGGVASNEGRAVDPRTLDTVDNLVALRRRAQHLLGSGAVVRLRNEIERLRQAEAERVRKWRRRRKHLPSDAQPALPPFSFTPAQARVLAQEQLLVGLESLAADVRQLEDLALDALYAGRALDRTDLSQTCETLQRALEESLLRLYWTQGERNDILTLAIYGELPARAIELADAYQRLAAAEQATTTRYWLKRHDPSLLAATLRRPATTAASRGPVLRLLHRVPSSAVRAGYAVDVYEAASTDGEQPPEGLIGVALQIRSQLVALLLDAEGGRHLFGAGAGRPADCFVEATSRRIVDYHPPADAGRLAAFRDLKLRRIYDFEREVCRDCILERAFPLRGNRIDEVLARAVRDEFQQRLWRSLD